MASALVDDNKCGYRQVEHVPGVTVAHRTAKNAAIAIDESELTVPHDGVIATRPATTPEAAPNVVGLPSRICSTVSQPSMPRHPATRVFRKIDNPK